MTSRLRRHGPRAGVAHLLREFHEEVPVEERVHVARQTVEYPPVAYVEFLADALADLDRQHPRRQMQQSPAQGRHEDDRHAIEEQADQQSGQYQEPEPDEDVRLLVDDVEG